MKQILALFLLFSTLFSQEISKSNLEKLCSKNNSGGCHNLATYEYNEKNYEKAYKIYQKACNLKFQPSCFNVGLFNELGVGTPKDEFKAFDMYKSTCVKGKKGYSVTFGCQNLAMLYIDGRGTRQNFNEGLKILDETCKAGVFANCEKLASIYENGYLSIEKNIAKTAEILKFSCDKGDANSCVKFAKITLESKNIDEKSAKNGIEMLKKACDLKVDSACMELGLFYTNAKFVAQDLKIAKEYFGKACDLRNTKGCESYKLINESGI